MAEVDGMTLGLDPLHAAEIIKRDLSVYCLACESVHRPSQAHNDPPSRSPEDQAALERWVEAREAREAPVREWFSPAQPSLVARLGDLLENRRLPKYVRRLIREAIDEIVSLENAGYDD
jgi:hypothetical protein